jgi:uncharacterized protein YndB with AHSA1/START domain
VPVLLNLAIAAVVILVLLVVFVATRPTEFRVTRSTRVMAPPARVFARVNDFHQWEAWNPWGKMDPHMKQTYEGPPGGVGSVYSWVGNSQVGEGRMTVVESRPDELIQIKLEFFKPFAATNRAEFTFESEGAATTVTWSMSGERNFITKAIGLFMNMDKMIGGQFEKGLADMKAVVESGKS